MVSIATAVLPIWRSPMISSRCPRPMGTIESMALSPVCRGCFTGWRKITPGALRSRGIGSSSPWMGPRPSIGCPSTLITRPNTPSPTLIEAISPVRFTVMFSDTLFTLLRRITPTLLSSRLRATPLTPFSNSTSSLAHTLSRPYTRATPSPTSRTMPVSSNDTLELTFSNCCFST